MVSQAIDDLTVSAPQLGKTVTGALWLFSEAVRHGEDPRPWWWTAPTYVQAKHGMAVLAHFARGSGMLSSATNTPPLRLELSTGGSIEGRSWDRPEGMYGPSVLGGVVDEFGQLTPQAYQAISSRRAETIQQGFGQFRYLGNVGPLGGTAHHLWKMAERKETGFVCRRWTWRDRMASDPCHCGLPIALENAEGHERNCPRRAYAVFIAHEAARMSPVQFRSLWEAEWVDYNELPVYEFDRAVHVNPDLEFQRQLPLEIACDFNVDPMAWIIGQSLGTEMWALSEIGIPGGATTQDACNEVIRRYPFPKVDLVVYGDASGTARKTSASQTDYQIIRAILGGYYRTLAIRVPKANPPVQDRVNAFNALLRPQSGPPRYAVHPSCLGLIEDLALVSWRPGTRDLDKSDKSRTHYTDADGYRVHSLFRVSGPARLVDFTAPMLTPDPIVDAVW